MSQLLRPCRILSGANRYLPLSGLTSRFKHRNHPGHKVKAPIIQTRYELPDRFVDEALYPPVKPKFPPGDWEPTSDPKLAWLHYDEGQRFHCLRTVQERLSVLAYLNVQKTVDDLKNMRTRFFPIYLNKAAPSVPKMLPFNQYITKTNVSVVDRLPGEMPIIVNPDETTFEPLNLAADCDVFDDMKQMVIQCILANVTHKNHDDIEKVVHVPEHKDEYKSETIEQENSLNTEVTNTNALLRDIFNSLTTMLAAVSRKRHAHLLDVQYSNDVPIKAYWKRCGFANEKAKGLLYPDRDSIRLQFEDTATYQIKCAMPLQPLFKLSDEECLEYSASKDTSKVPQHIYNPSTFKLFTDHVLPMQIPGHWYGDKREFNYCTVFNTSRMQSYFENKYEDYDEEQDTLSSMAINAGHAELTAQAYYLGFSMWRDLTYPLVGQYILSNGQSFSIAKYQLNTIRLWNKANKLNNLCFITKPEKLFELNDEFTEVKMFNDNLLKRIINTLSNKPAEEAESVCPNYSQLDHMIGGTRLRPYLPVQDFEGQLSTRHQLFAISLYESLKYDKPMTYLEFHKRDINSRPRFQAKYGNHTMKFRDIVLNYYPRDFWGFNLLCQMIKVAPREKEIFWDLKSPVFEWANVPPPHSNSIPRNINLPKF